MNWFPKHTITKRRRNSCTRRSLFLVSGGKPDAVDRILSAIETFQRDKKLQKCIYKNGDRDKRDFSFFVYHWDSLDSDECSTLLEKLPPAWKSLEILQVANMDTCQTIYSPDGVKCNVSHFALKISKGSPRYGDPPKGDSYLEIAKALVDKCGGLYKKGVQLDGKDLEMTFDGQKFDLSCLIFLADSFDIKFQIKMREEKCVLYVKCRETVQAADDQGRSFIVP